MTHESDKNVFLNARSQFKVIEEALDDIIETHGGMVKETKIITAALHKLDLSVREIVDEGARLANAAKHDSTLSDIICRADSFLTQSESFFKGTERATLKQEQADAEARYEK